jgi:hypothetical protein
MILLWGRNVCRYANPLQIHSRRQLTTLCLVNKTFNAAVTPFLYRELTIGGSKAKLDAACLAMTKHRRYIRGVSVIRCKSLGDLYYQGIVERILPGMPLLESFTQVTNPPKHWLLQLTDR